MTLFTKVKWVLGILLVFFLVLMTNLIDRNNFIQVKDSITTIYEDRLIANDLIIKMMRQVHEKELALLAPTEVSAPLVNADFRELIASYEATKLTEQESRIFNDLKSNLDHLADAGNAGEPKKGKAQSLLAAVKENLVDLSSIQIDEGKRQMLMSKKAVATVELFTEIEIYILILLAVFVQVIVMYKPKRAIS